jgi:ribosomal protein S27AE
MTPTTDHARSGNVETQWTPAGANLRVQLACPKCGVTGWVKWSSLNRAMHCPKCGCEFLMGRHGQLLSLGDLPQVRFTCPRCGKSGWLPSTSFIRNAQCADCKLPLVAGPDQRLHGAREAAQMQREAAEQARGMSHRQWLLANARGATGQTRGLHIVALVVSLVAAAGVAAGVATTLFDRSAEALARRFTAACLAGDRGALDFLERDPVQAVELERFRLRQFASILDKHRPSGDRVSIDVAVVRATADARVLEIRLASGFLGTRTHEQVWYLRDGQWCFGAQQTLAAQDHAAAPPAAPASPTDRARRQRSAMRNS